MKREKDAEHGSLTGEDRKSKINRMGQRSLAAFEGFWVQPMTAQSGACLSRASVRRTDAGGVAQFAQWREHTRCDRSPWPPVTASPSHLLTCSAWPHTLGTRCALTWAVRHRWMFKKCVAREMQEDKGLHGVCLWTQPRCPCQCCRTLLSRRLTAGSRVFPHYSNLIMVVVRQLAADFFNML